MSHEAVKENKESTQSGTTPHAGRASASAPLGRGTERNSSEQHGIVGAAAEDAKLDAQGQQGSTFAHWYRIICDEKEKPSWPRNTASSRQDPN
jgi:hypothetical protein